MKRCLHVVAVLWFCCGLAHAFDAVVHDAHSGAPVAHASVVADGVPLHADAQGRLHLAARPEHLGARAIGYAPAVVPTPAEGAVVPLVPLRPKALYLSVYGIGSAVLREPALALAERSELNALVIDLKGDRGQVPHPSAVLRAEGVAQSLVTVVDVARLVDTLHAHGLYLIARIVVFKDDLWAEHHPEWAVHDAQGNVWRDGEAQRWIDPFQREAWSHSLALAEEAAGFGFDEVQFDYLRFPDAVGLRFSAPSTQAARTAAIGDFLAAARGRLARFNVFVAADIFGYVAWNENDTLIGQQLEALAGRVDYLCPMLYPSGFSFGIPGHPNPVAAPREIVDHTLRRAIERTGLPGVRWRPWLQAFRDYAFDHREFGAAELRAQIDAADALDTDGWMLWNPHNRYDAAGLRPAPQPP
jgi:hypothetical protein